MGKRTFSLCFALLLLGSTLASNYEGGPLALFGEWSLFRIFDSRKKEPICFTMTLPSRRYDNLNQRGESFFTVLKSKGPAPVEVFLSHGHISSDEILKAEINIAGRKFPILVHEDKAWTFSAFDDRSIVEQLEKAALFSVEIEYANGKNLIDVYQLNGFSESYSRLLITCD
jgi:hypothetical protein